MSSTEKHKSDEKHSTFPSPQEQQERVWAAVCAHNVHPEAAASSCPHSSTTQSNTSNTRKWPTYDTVMADVANSDYNSTLTCPHDVRHGGSHPQKGKALCPFGVAVCCKMELFPCPSSQKPYTGLLTPGTTLDSCIMRLSSAVKPPSHERTSRLAKVLLHAAGEKARKAKLFPTAAIKVFRSNNRHSGNVLFAGCKVGQHEDDYFAHAMCTQMTERMPRILKPFVRKFSQYSKHPLSLGVSDFCTFDKEGNVCTKPNFPFAIILSPCYTQQKQQRASTTNEQPEEKDAFDVFLDDSLHIPEGTVLFNIVCCPHPAVVSDPTKLQRIGRIVTSSQPIPSLPHDGLFFRHQRKEEDYEIRPEWKRYLKKKCVLQDGSTGTVEHLAGWGLFEGLISKETFVNFEQQQRQSS